MGKFDHLGSQRRAHNVIARWGGPGKLVRAGVERPCTIGRLDHRHVARGLFKDAREVLRISAYKLTVAPDETLDTIKFDGGVYKILEPVQAERPNTTTMFYDCNVARL
jgi:hypothetical protein